MKRKRIVVALGGNALGDSPKAQLVAVCRAAEAIAGLIRQGHEVIIGHGNGPQIGMINSALDYAASSGPRIPSVPFAECGAMSQGFIGYHLQQALQQELYRQNINKTVVSVVTQVVVDQADEAFGEPTKPIGNFYTKEEAEVMAAETGYRFMEDAGRGYRRVVASPKPVKIVELKAIRRMVQSGLTVIAAGGGGIPIIEGEHGYEGIDAVIDKDRSCSRLAQDLKADILMILTAVDYVCIHYNQLNQQELHELSEVEAARYIATGEFAKGSMLPKIEAAVEFVQALPGRTAIITSLNQASRALTGQVGTRIISGR